MKLNFKIFFVTIKILLFFFSEILPDVCSRVGTGMCGGGGC